MLWCKKFATFSKMQVGNRSKKLSNNNFSKASISIEKMRYFVKKEQINNGLSLFFDTKNIQTKIFTNVGICIYSIYFNQKII